MASSCARGAAAYGKRLMFQNNWLFGAQTKKTVCTPYGLVSEIRIANPIEYIMETGDNHEK